VNVCERASRERREGLATLGTSLPLHPDSNALEQKVDRSLLPSLTTVCCCLPSRIIPSTPVSKRKHERSREVRQIAKAPSPTLGAKRYNSTRLRRAQIRQENGQHNVGHGTRECSRHAAHVLASPCKNPEHRAICQLLLWDQRHSCLGSAHQREHVDKCKARG